MKPSGHSISHVSFHMSGLMSHDMDSGWLQMDARGDRFRLLRFQIYPGPGIDPVSLLSVLRPVSVRLRRMQSAISALQFERPATKGTMQLSYVSSPAQSLRIRTGPGLERRHRHLAAPSKAARVNVASEDGVKLSRLKKARTFRNLRSVPRAQITLQKVFFCAQTQLKDALAAAGLPADGKKDELVSRLEDHLAQQSEV